MIFNIRNLLNPRLPPDNFSSWLMKMGFCLIAFNSVLTVLVSDADFAGQARLHGVNFLTLCLLWCLRAFGQQAQPRAAAKLLAWIFSTLIMAILTWSMTMERAPYPLKIFIWGFVVVTSLVAFYFIFFSLEIRRDRRIRNLNVCFCFCLIFIFVNTSMVTYGTINITDRVNSEIFEFVSWLGCMLQSVAIIGMGITSENSEVRGYMKFFSWAFGTMLAAMFAAKVAHFFPWLMRYVAWAMAIASSFSTFYAFFLQREDLDIVNREV